MASYGSIDTQGVYACGTIRCNHELYFEVSEKALPCQGDFSFPSPCVTMGDRSQGKDRV